MKLAAPFLPRLLLAPILALLLQTAHAALPDPVRFGIVMEMGDVEQAREWLNEGLPPGFLADHIGTGLMIGAWEGNIPLMELFLSRGARIDQENSAGEQALQLAAWRGQTEAVRWLLSRGAKINRPGKGWSALHYAAFAGHKDLVKYLLSRGADVNAKAPNESTVLMMAVREGHEDTVKDLLQAGADPRLVNDRGDTALVWAMRNNRLSIAKVVAESPEKFIQAVKAPPETFGKAVRSEPAPAEVSEILRQIRIARAEGKNMDALQNALMAMAAKLRKQAAEQPKVVPGALLITARRQNAGEEKAELQYAGGRPGSTPAAVLAPDNTVSDILYRMRRAQAEGKPVDDLRAALLEAVSKLAK